MFAPTFSSEKQKKKGAGQIANYLKIVKNLTVLTFGLSRPAALDVQSGHFI